MHCFICENQLLAVDNQLYSVCRHCQHQEKCNDSSNITSPVHMVNETLDYEKIIRSNVLDQSKLRTVRKFRDNCRNILDLGCGSGGFLKKASKDFTEHLGIEVTPECLEFARTRLGLNVTDQLPPSKSLASTLVTSWHSLEHFKRQAVHNLFASLQRNSDKDTILLICVPNAKSLQWKLYGTGYAYYDPDTHEQQFTPSSLDRLLHQYGFFRVADPFLLPYIFFGHIQGLMNSLIRSPRNFFYYRFKRSETFGLSPVRLRALTFLSLLMLPIMLPLAGLFTAVEWLFLRESRGVLTAVCKKSVRS